MALSLASGAAAEGIYWQHVPCLLRSLEEKGESSLAGMVRLVACGGHWPEQRLADAKLVVNAICQRCHRLADCSIHRFWGCKCNDVADSPLVQETNHFRHQAREEAPAAPPFWCKGLIPSSRLAIPDPRVPGGYFGEGRC